MPEAPPRRERRRRQPARSPADRVRQGVRGLHRAPGIQAWCISSRVPQTASAPPTTRARSQDREPGRPRPADGEVEQESLDAVEQRVDDLVEVRDRRHDRHLGRRRPGRQGQQEDAPGDGAEPRAPSASPRRSSTRRPQKRKGAARKRRPCRPKRDRNDLRLRAWTGRCARGPSSGRAWRPAWSARPWARRLAGGFGAASRASSPSPPSGFSLRTVSTRPPGGPARAVGEGFLAGRPCPSTSNLKSTNSRIAASAASPLRAPSRRIRV